MRSPVAAYPLLEVLVERSGRVLAARIELPAREGLILHLQDLPDSSVWALLNASSVDVSAAHWDHWDDEGWHDVYEELPEDDGVLVLLVKDEVVVAEADVTPRPAEVEALLDAALDVFLD